MNRLHIIRRFRESIPAKIGIATALVLVTIVGQVPGDSRFSAALQNGCHSPVFFLLTLIVISLLTGPFAYLRTIGLGAVLGIGIELVQGQIGGDVSLLDVCSDMAGVIAAVGVHAFRAQRLGGFVATLIVAIGTLYWIAPIMWCCAAYANRAMSYPTLVRFQTSLDRYFLLDSIPEPEIVAMPRQWSEGAMEYALYVILPHSQWPGIELSEASPNWSGFRGLNIDLVNPNATSLQFTLRVNDRSHNNAFNDRFNTNFAVAPRTRAVLRFPLVDLQRAPAGRSMDIRHMQKIVIFASAQSTGKPVYLSRIWLD